MLKMEVGNAIILGIQSETKILIELFAKFIVLRWHKGFDFSNAQVGHVGFLLNDVRGLEPIIGDTLTISW